LNGGGAQDAGSFGIGAGIGNTGNTSSLSQSIVSFDTSSIPDANTIASTVLNLTASSGVNLFTFADPSVAVLEARYYGTSAPSNIRGNNDNHWLLSTSQFAAKTLVATYPAASAWIANTSYALTSETALATNVNKTGNTVLVLSTDEYATAVAGSGTQGYAIENGAAASYLTVVHSLLGSATVTASATATPAISRVPSFPRTIAAAATATAALSRIASFPRTIAASVTASPSISRVASFARTIAATVTAVPAIVATYMPLVVQLPRILRLAGRSTITLVSQSTLRLLGRSTLKLPKE